MDDYIHVFLELPCFPLQLTSLYMLFPSKLILFTLAGSDKFRYRQEVWAS